VPESLSRLLHERSMQHYPHPSTLAYGNMAMFGAVYAQPSKLLSPANSPRRRQRQLQQQQQISPPRAVQMHSTQSIKREPVSPMLWQMAQQPLRTLPPLSPTALQLAAAAGSVTGPAVYTSSMGLTPTISARIHHCPMCKRPFEASTGVQDCCSYACYHQQHAQQRSVMVHRLTVTRQRCHVSRNHW